MDAHPSSCGSVLDETQAYQLVEQVVVEILALDWPPSAQTFTDDITNVHTHDP